QNEGPRRVARRPHPHPGSSTPHARPTASLPHPPEAHLLLRPALVGVPFHSCNHRACPQCGRTATAEWVERELAKRINAPYFMVTFTLPQELRELFFGAKAKEAFDLFFRASSRALSETLAS